MPIESTKSKEVEATLPEHLRPAYRQIVGEYEFLTKIHCGRGYVAYNVLAELVLAGWRPSDPAHSSSRFAGEKQRGHPHVNNE